MALGTFTIIEEVASQGPVMWHRCTLVGDGAYPSGGSAGFEALYQAAAQAAGVLSEGSGRTIVALLNDDLNDDDGSGSSDGIILQYDHTADKLRVMLGKTMVESAQSDQSSITWKFTLVSK